MIVTFCGHSELHTVRESILAWLDRILPPLIEQGADTFYLGGYGDFDRLAAGAVRRQKAEHPGIEAVLVLAYPDRKVNSDRYDCSIYPGLENVPRRFAISRRNEWMVDNADVVVGCVLHDWGGATKTLAYARRKRKTILAYPEEGGDKPDSI